MAVLADSQIAALVILLVSSLGLSANWFITLFIRRLKSLQNSFGWLARAQAFVEAVHNSLFCFYFVPMVFFDIEVMKQYSQHCGQLILICYDLTVFLHLLISLNRMCAIFLPLRYSHIFSYSHTMIAIVFVFILEISTSIYFFDFNDCAIYYLGDFYRFAFKITDVCFFIAWYTDLMRNLTLVMIISIIDIVTVAKVHNARKMMNEMITSEAVKRRRAQEVNFLKQACLQAIVFVCELITYFVLEPKFDNKWAKFFLTTVAWVGVHCIDGFIILTFNREFRLLIPCLKNLPAIGPTETFFTSNSSHINYKVESGTRHPSTQPTQPAPNEIYGTQMHDSSVQHQK